MEIEGKQLLTWQPWHFDHTYNNELNRAGVLRAEIIAPEGGMTALPMASRSTRGCAGELRKKLETSRSSTRWTMHYSRQPYGLPKNFK